MASALHPLNVATVFEAPWLRIEALVMSPDPAETPYYRLVDAPGVICITLSTAGDFVMVRQARPVVERMTLEFPAGRVDAGETAEEAVRREVFEETGLKLVQLARIGEAEPVPSRMLSHQTIFLGIVTAEGAAAAEKGSHAVHVSRDALGATFKREVNDCIVALGAIKMAEVQWGIDTFRDPINVISQRLSALSAGARTDTARASC